MPTISTTAICRIVRFQIFSVRLRLIIFPSATRKRAEVQASVPDHAAIVVR